MTMTEGSVNKRVAANLRCLAGELETAQESVAVGNNIKKIIVAVHGIGDQFRYATIQSVIARFCSYHGLPSAVPLGKFHVEQRIPNQREPLSVVPPYPIDKFGELAFTEVYWADIPDKVMKDGHTLEEARLWARTIVDRLQLRSKDGEEFQRELKNEIANLEREHQKLLKEDGPESAVKIAQHVKSLGMVEKACTASKLEKDDYSMLKQALDEMIQTIAILERLSFLADRAGVFTFDLRNLLDCYLGDVQIVTEFKEQRRRILDEFQHVMAQAYRFAPEAEIYIVAHSEGTVVSFLGLLEALSDAQTPAWVKHVRGLMTIGSPIDKHLILWPDELWTEFRKVPEEETAKDGTAKEEKGWIKWYNYYDYGDPVGYELNEAREWLAEHKWNRIFDFQKENDIGFWRYPLPGKAHVDYWKDEEVFGHFIENVILRQPAQDQDGVANPRFSDKPSSKWLPLLTSYVFSYIGIGALLFAAVFILYKALHVCLDPNPAGGQSNIEVFRNVLGMACLLYGVTVTARIPRLTRTWYWQLLGPAFFALSAAAFFWLLPGDAGWGRFLSSIALLVVVTLFGMFGKSRSYGFKPLIGIGGAAVAILMVAQVVGDTGDRGPLWPLVLATLGFTYLWWLAALIFDLVFVWHLYIHSSKALKRMGEIAASPYARDEWKKASVNQ